MLNKNFIAYIAIVGFALLNSAPVQALNFKLITKNPVQGSMIIGQVIGDGEISFEQHKLSQTQNGIVVFGVGRDASEEVYVILKSLDGKSKKVAITVKQRKWKIERVDGLPPSKVNPVGDEVLKRIRKEGKLVREARAKASDLEFFLDRFILPAKGRISGVYGSQRVLNGQPKRPHFGLDVANKTGTPVLAPVNGVVSLVHNDMYYSGGTLIIDHGYGISSTYIHLNSVDVKAGDKVSQGQQIGTIGATGRATGPHLDWRLNWFNTRLDPQLLIENVKDTNVKGGH